MQSIKQKIYPSSWKNALVTACAKTNDVTYQNPKLYTPIAVTSIQARVLDKIVLRTLEENMKSWEDINQFAYKSNYSTSDALIFTIHFIARSLDEFTGSAVKITFIDYSSAFNTVLQNQLLDIIGAISNSHKQWLKSYMNGWNQNVNSSNSSGTESKEVTVGIHHGGPLSAKLFT